MVNEINTPTVGETPSLKLSPVELELLALLADGLSNREIARVKGVKIKSCENAISRIAKKLEIRQSPATNQRVLLVRKYLNFQGERFHQ